MKYLISLLTASYLLLFQHALFCRESSPTQPLEEGYLQVSEKHQLYYATFGNPAGTPVVVLHGGPGTGCSKDMIQFFDNVLKHMVSQGEFWHPRTKMPKEKIDTTSDRPYPRIRGISITSLAYPSESRKEIPERIARLIADSSEEEIAAQMEALYKRAINLKSTLLLKSSFY